MNDLDDIREIVTDLLDAARAYSDQQAMPDPDNVNRERAMDRAQRWLDRRPVGPCPCECNSGGFCGGCGHAGCGGRR